MKNHRVIVIAKIIFIVSVLYSYNSNASPLYNAINGLVSLIDQVQIKQHQRKQKDVPFFSDVALKESVRLLRLYHASLLARKQPREVSSKDVYANKIKKQNLRCQLQGSNHGNVQLVSTLLTSRPGMAYFPLPKIRGVCSDPESIDFSKTDVLTDQEVYEKAKAHLSKMYGLLKNDMVFSSTCTNLDLGTEYKITIDLINAALH